jgi:hypothetical protein
MKIAAGNCFKVLSVFFLFVLISACGGGGGDFSSDLSYTGSVAPASLTSSNSATLLSDAYSGGDAATILGSIGTAASLTNAAHDAPRQPRGLALSAALIKFVRLSATNDTPGTTSVAAAVNDIPTNTVNGNCGGTATVSGSYDDASGAISLSANFNGYCQDDTNLNGSVSASGNATTTSSSGFSISNISITVSNLTADLASGDAFAADGTLSIVPQAGYTSIDTHSVVTIDMTLRDNTTTKVYKLSNYKISQTVTVAYNDLNITGRYYDPDEGYIDLSTPATIRVMTTDPWPSDGSLLGTGDNSSATLTALDSTTYQLDVDTDNNGTPDYTTTGLWSAI